MPTHQLIRIFTAALLTFGACHAVLTAQVDVESDLFVADRGNAMNGSDGEIRRYSHTGALLTTLPSSGSGAIRGIAFDLNDNLFVARGNEVLRYVGDPYVPDATPFAMGTRIQNVEAHPVTGNIWVSAGVNASEAMIMEFDATGMLIQTITDSQIVQPRSFCFSEDGERLYVANVEGNNVLVIDLTATPPLVGVHSSLGTFGSSGYAPISIARDPAFESDDLYVAGDYVASDDILRITGAAGSGTAQSVVSLATSPVLNAAGGMWVDSWGSLYVCSRDRDMGTPGLVPFRLDGQPQTVLPYVGTEHINPIDVAFMKRRIAITITDDVQPFVFQDNGNAAIVIGSQQPQIQVTVDTPDYPNSVYVISFSLMTNGQCANGDPVRPSGEGIPFDVSDPRRTPLELDAVYLQAQQVLAAAINASPMSPPPLNLGFVPYTLLPDFNCPTSVPGFSRFQFGLTDANGVGRCYIQFPTFPPECFPLPFDIRFGFAAAVLDMTTGPLGVGLISGAPTCLTLFHL